MTAQEKAEELKEKLWEICGSDFKEVANILLDEISGKLPNINDTPPIYRMPEDHYRQYWFEVKRYLNK